MSNGRPLRFLGVVVGGWIAFRVVVLWPSIETLPDLARAVVPIKTAAASETPLLTTVAVELPPPVSRTDASGAAPSPSTRQRSRLLIALEDPTNVVASTQIGPPEAKTVAQAAAQPGLASPAPAPSRWSISAWVIGRGGRGASLDSPQLGGSQAGARIAYLIDRRHRLAVAGRIVTPLAGRGREAALGLDWQPTRLPVRLLVEQRFGLDGQRGGPAALVVGGFGPAPLWRGFTLEGYGEAGAVARHRLDKFVDGALRLAHPIAMLETVRFDLGAGLWGAAQRGVSRIDVGPSIGATIPIDHHTLRLSVDWRQRVAGNARPGSGPAVTLGADF